MFVFSVAWSSASPVDHLSFSTSIPSRMHNWIVVFLPLPALES
jgi:hypothetical protein